MEGQGAYNANSALQASGAALALPLLVEAARSIRLDAEDGPIVVADYGSSEGRNSIVATKAVLPELRARSARPILVTHIDVSVNDFSTLFELVAHDKGGYAGADGVFACAVGRSFYRPALPADHVHLGWSSYAAQWLSKMPSPITGHIFSQRGQPCERQAFADQARSDWETFLTLRCREMRKGACLVIVLPAPDPNGSHPILRLLRRAAGPGEALNRCRGGSFWTDRKGACSGSLSAEIAGARQRAAIQAQISDITCGKSIT
ncbi:MAG: hypothetical protein JO273_23470 [Methylobacteriaceae bacterium]|nr:hypothetical protein [Methylobacteriaceae bacterium]